jgi:hypothetical protein
LPTQSGGAGGRGGGQYSWEGSPGDAYDNDDDVSLLMYLPGSGGGAGAGGPSTVGGAGGAGGASILLYSTEMTLNGVVKANGGAAGGKPSSSVSILSESDWFIS